MDLTRISGLTRTISTVALAAALALTGCRTAPVEQPQAPEAPPERSASGTNPATRADITGTGTVRLATAALPKNWNPYHADSPGRSFFGPIGPLLPSYVTYSDKGEPRINLGFIKTIAWTKESRAILTLNPDAKWADGKPIKPADWVATWKALNGSNPEFRASLNWSAMKEMTGDDANNVVEIQFDGPQPNWQWLLRHGPLPAAGVKDPEAFNTGWSQPKPGWFAGPYLVQHIDTKQGLITEAPNKYYPNPGLLDNVTFRVLSPEDHAVSFTNDELDAVPLKKKTTAFPADQIRVGSSRTRKQVEIDSAKIPDRGIRQAISSAITFDAPEGTTVTRNLLFSVGQSGYKDSARASGLTPGADATVEIMTANGWSLGSDSYWVRDGKRCQVTLSTDKTDRTETAAIAKVLDHAGFSVGHLPEGAIRVTEKTIDRFPLENARQASAAKNAAPELVELVGLALKERNQIRQTDLLGQVATKLWLESEQIPMYAMPEFTAVKPKLANIGSFGLSTGDWAAVGWTK